MDEWTEIMALRQSHIQGLNKGRNRRNEAFADVESVLDQLEHKLASSALDGNELSAFSNIQARLDRLEQPSANQTPIHSNQPSQSSSDFRQALNDLKEELSSGFQKQFDLQLKTIQSDWLALAKDMRAQIQASSSQNNATEIQSLAQAVADLRNSTLQSDNTSVDSEIQSLRSDLNTLAREDSLETLNRRWDNLEDNWQTLGAHLASKSEPQDLGSLTQQLAMIEERLHVLPSNEELNHVLEEVRALQNVVAQNSAGSDINFSTSEIDARLDEITRAIAASPMQQSEQSLETVQKIEGINLAIQQLASEVSALNTPQNTFQDDSLNDEKFAAIENQLLALQSSLSDVITHAANNSSTVALENGLGEISQRLEETLVGSTDTAARLADIEIALARLINTPNSDANVSVSPVPDMSFQVEELTQKIENAASQINSNIELAASQKRQVAIDPKSISSAIDGRLQKFLEEFRKNAPISREPQDTGEVVRALENGFQNISSRLETSNQPTPNHEEAFAALATRLDAVTHLLQQPSVASENGDGSTNLTEFEAQLANLANRVNVSVESFAALSPRLENIERSLEFGKSEAIDASRIAAETAIRNALEGFQLNSSTGNDPAVAQLAADISSLQELAKGNDGRNAKTFGAIHETLLKIVDRLEEIEARPAISNDQNSGSNADYSTNDGNYNNAASSNFVAPPPLAADYSPTELGFADEPIAPNDDADYYGDEKPKLSPAEAAKAAASAALSDTGNGMGAQDAAQRFSQSLDSAQEEFGAAGGDAYGDGQSTSPDLNSILKKVRDQRAEGAGRPKQNSAPADLLASARRAAKAAASEAETLKTDADVKGRLGERDYGAMFGKAKLPLVVGALGLVVVIAGLQLSSMFSGGGEEIDFNEPMAIEGTSTDSNLSEFEATPATSQNNDVDTLSMEAMEMSAADGTTEFSPIMEGTESGEQITPVSGEAPTNLNASITNTAPEVAPDAPEFGFGTPALKTAVSDGDASAFFEVGRRHAEGRGTAADLTKAAQWFEQSAELGFAPAQFRIGNFYEKGRGVTRDINTAISWYEKAGDQGNTAAMHNLAVLYASGASGAPDNASAGKWFEKAAEYGLTDSQFNLAILKAKGLGQEKDLIQSYKWFAVAAKGGDSEAGKKRDEVATMMSPEKLKEAQAHVDLWQAKPVVTAANTFTSPEEWRVDVAKTASVDMKKAIKNIQLILEKNGYKPGTPDGVMGSKTKAAIKKFQAAVGLPATGEINDALVKALLAKNT